MNKSKRLFFLLNFLLMYVNVFEDVANKKTSHFPFTGKRKTRRLKEAVVWLRFGFSPYQCGFALRRRCHRYGVFGCLLFLC